MRFVFGRKPAHFMLVTLAFWLTSLPGCTRPWASLWQEEKKENHAVRDLAPQGPLFLKEAKQCRQFTEPGPSAVRRLTRVEYDNTVKDLLGVTGSPAFSFVPEEETHGFTNNGDVLAVPPLLAEQLMQAAETLAEMTFQQNPKFFTCSPGSAGELPCAEEFIRTQGKRTFRRPLHEDEVAGLLKVYQETAQLGGPNFGLRHTLQAMLQSPAFLYRFEIGSQPIAGIAALDDYELASQLSYLLWNTMPDDILLSAADAGKLRNPAELEAQARRLLKHPRARASLRHFFSEWLGLGKLVDRSKDASIYPDFDLQLKADLIAEMEAFIDHVVWEKDGRLQTLLTDRTAFLNARLGAVYGVPGITGEAMRKVQLPPERAGLLSRAGLLALLGKPGESAPIDRGKFVREKVLCQHLSPPPASAMIQPPPRNPQLTTRERFAQHSQNKACASCHYLIDPLGFGFERFDGIGRYRVKENGRDVDESGEVLETWDANGAFAGVADLSQKLSASTHVQACFVTQVFRYSFGRLESSTDSCALSQVFRDFSQSNTDIRELIIGIVRSPGFRFRRMPQK